MSRYATIQWQPVRGYTIHWYTGEPLNYHLPICTYAEAKRLCQERSMPLDPNAVDPRPAVKA